MIPEHPDEPQVIVNEFAAVEVSIDHSANTPRLRLLDQESGQIAYVDALELAGWCRTDPDRRAELIVQVEPYRRRDGTDDAHG